MSARPLQGLGAKSIAFVRLPGFIIFWILSKFAGSPRARERMWMNQSARYGILVPDHTMAMLLGLVSWPGLVLVWSGVGLLARRLPGQRVLLLCAAPAVLGILRNQSACPPPTTTTCQHHLV